MPTKNLTIAFGIASMLVSSATAHAIAGSIPTMTATVGQAAPRHAIDVCWRGFGWRGYGGGHAFDLAAGELAGAALVGPYYGGRSYYYGATMPYYSRPVYAAPYGYAPAYGSPVYPGYYAPYGGYSYVWPSRCFTQEGYGRYRPCSAN